MSGPGLPAGRPPFRAGTAVGTPPPGPPPPAPGSPPPGPVATATHGASPTSAPDGPAWFVPGGPPDRSRLAHGPLPRAVWFTLLALATAALVATRLPLDLAMHLVEHHVPEGAAVVVTTLYAAALAHRIGGRPFVSLVVGLVLGVAAVATGAPEVTAGVAATTAVLAGMLAVLTTVPAPTAPVVLREVVLALVLAGVGALAVSAYGAAVQPMRFRYLVLGVALLLSLAVVARVGAGLNGLSPRGSLVLAVAVAAVVVAVAYGEALSQWGSADLVDTLARLRSGLRDHLGAVPHPIEVLIGWPALVWGLWQRARRPHAWWVCAFGVAATVPTACALLDPEVGVQRAVLGAAYSLVLGLLLGAAVVGVDRAVTRSRGRRTAATDAASGTAPEPGRTRSLL